MSDSLFRALIVSALECFLFCLFSSLTASAIITSPAGFCLGDCISGEADLLASPAQCFCPLIEPFAFNLMLFD